MGDKVDAETVFTEFTNSGGWPSLGLAVLVGQITPIFSFLGKRKGSLTCTGSHNANILLGPDGATHIGKYFPSWWLAILFLTSVHS